MLHSWEVEGHRSFRIVVVVLAGLIVGIAARRILVIPGWLIGSKIWLLLIGLEVLTRSIEVLPIATPLEVILVAALWGYGLGLVCCHMASVACGLHGPDYVP